MVRFPTDSTNSENLEVKLVSPHTAFKESYLEGLQEFQTEGLRWFRHLDYTAIKAGFENYVSELRQRPNRRTEKLVPETVFWAIGEDQYVGQISVRHELNDALKIFGGHIGYDTRPSFRQQGVASAMLRQALPLAKNLGLEEVLLTCNDDNVASIKIIEKNGGKLRDRHLQYPGGPLKRYYLINLL